MILNSKLNNKYAWVRIPKTATRAYTKLLAADNKHYHMEYSRMMELETIKIPCVTVVREPHSRFVSMMKHFSQILYAQMQHPRHRNHITYSIPVENTNKFCDFFYKFYDKNCIPFELNTHYTIMRHNVQIYMPFFKTQKTMILGAENPIIFRYDNLNEFNNWLETEIAVDTSNLEHIGKITTEFPFNIDLQSSQIKNLVGYLFEEDYELFNY